MPKYKPTINKIEQKGSFYTMQKEGFTKSQIINSLYRETRGASQSERKEIFKNMTDKRG
jgi:hypothetical protein